jgi:ribonuclease BN (tRNA processing enzyme)
MTRRQVCVRAAAIVSAVLFVRICVAGQIAEMAGWAASRSPCSGNAVAVQVLGSGGPMHGQGRGSSAYLVWVHHQPFALVDIGGDTPTALVKAGVAAGAIPTLLISHLHPDHVSGLPDFLWGEITAHRKEPLTIVGPDGDQRFPGIATFLHRLFGEEGAFVGMQGVLDGSDMPLDIRSVPTSRKEVLQVADRSGVKIFTYPVSHGKAPSIAFRIDGGDFRIVFGGDQAYLDPGFAGFAMKADILILHAIANEQVATEPLAGIVGVPGDLGQTALRSQAKHVILSHLMLATNQNSDSSLWSLADLSRVRATIERAYGAPVAIAEDSLCFAVTSQR